VGTVAKIARAPLAIKGWSQRSVFGWDAAKGGWWADLYRDYHAQPARLIRDLDSRWLSADAEVLAHEIDQVTGIKPYGSAWAAMYPEMRKPVAAIEAAEEARWEAEQARLAAAS
jgi:hypothetical protein